MSARDTPGPPEDGDNDRPDDGSPESWSPEDTPEVLIPDQTQARRELDAAAAEMVDPPDFGGLPESGDGSLGGEGPSGGDRYEPEVAAATEQAALVEQVAALKKELAEMVERVRQSVAESAALAEEVGVLREIVQDETQVELISADGLGQGAGQDPDRLASAAALAGSAKRRAKWGRKRFGGELWDRVWEETKEILRRLWKMIAHLVRVKEWTVQGQAGAGLFGLASASVSITFGS